MRDLLRDEVDVGRSVFVEFAITTATTATTLVILVYDRVIDRSTEALPDRGLIALPTVGRNHRDRDEPSTKIGDEGLRIDFVALSYAVTDDELLRSGNRDVRVGVAKLGRVFVREARLLLLNERPLLIAFDLVNVEIPNKLVMKAIATFPHEQNRRKHGRRRDLGKARRTANARTLYKVTNDVHALSKRQNVGHDDAPTVPLSSPRPSRDVPSNRTDEGTLPQIGIICSAFTDR